MNRTTTILPPPSDFPVPMPEPPSAVESPESGAWRALVELTKETVRPGRGDSGKPASGEP